MPHQNGNSEGSQVKTYLIINLYFCLRSGFMDAGESVREAGELIIGEETDLHITEYFSQ